MTDEYAANWYALIQALELLWKHAETHGIDPDTINYDSRKIVREYVKPISGDILVNMKLSRQLQKEGITFNQPSYC